MSAAQGACLREGEDDVAGGDAQEGERALLHDAAELLEHLQLLLLECKRAAQAPKVARAAQHVAALAPPHPSAAVAPAHREVHLCGGPLDGRFCNMAFGMTACARLSPARCHELAGPSAAALVHDACTAGCLLHAFAAG